MAGLVGVRWATGAYIMAEGFGLGFISHEDVVFIAKQGERVIGCAIFRVVGHPGKGKGKSWGTVRAWTVEMAFRRQGVGRSLLEKGCRVVMAEKGCEWVEFAKDHASESQAVFFDTGLCVWIMLISRATDSARVLPNLFNGYFDRREEKARRSLEKFVRTEPPTVRKH